MLSLTKIRNLVAAFEAGRLRPHNWNHRTRLILGFWYLFNPDARGSKEALRRGISKHEAGRGLCPTYDEQTTAFYLQSIETFAIAAPPDLGLVELLEALLVSPLANPGLHRKSTGFTDRDGAADETGLGSFAHLGEHSISLPATAYATEANRLLCPAAQLAGRRLKKAA